MPEQQAAFRALLDLAQRTRRSAKGLPAQLDIRPHWSGVGFSLLGQRFVAPMGQVSEMLEVPGYTHLPNVQAWVKGVANVRGRLLPIYDMANFFGTSLSGHRKLRRVLVLEIGGLYTGLMVDQVFGMQHFPMDTYQEEAGHLPAEVKPFVEGCYPAGAHLWSVFNPATLATDERFADAAMA